MADHPDDGTDFDENASLLHGLLGVAESWPESGTPTSRTAANLSNRLARLERDFRRGALDAWETRRLLANVVDDVDDYWWSRRIMPLACGTAIRRGGKRAAHAARSGDLRPAHHLARALRTHWTRLARTADLDSASRDALERIFAFDDRAQPSRFSGNRLSHAAEQVHHMVVVLDELFQARSRSPDRELSALRTALTDLHAESPN